MISRALRWMAALCILPGIAVAQPSTAPGPSSLQPGDAVRITVFQTPELSGEFGVAADGTLQHPVYNRLTVVGVPTTTLRARVEEFLRTLQREPQVNVEPLVRITVGGEVRQPNSYLFAPELTVADAVASAGGATPQGRLDRVTLERDGSVRTLDLSRPDADLRATEIRSGDRITIARQRNLLRDTIGPAASIAGTIFTIINLLTRR